MVCPIRAWFNYVRVMAPSTSGPTFLLDKSKLLTASPVVATIRAALSQAGYSNVTGYSLYSLRPGAAQLAASLGASNSEIMMRGISRSEAGMRHYIPSSITVPKILAKGLGLKL